MIQQNIYSTIQMFEVSEIFLFFKSHANQGCIYLIKKKSKTVILWNI